MALRLYTFGTDIRYDLPEGQLEFTGLPQDLIKTDAANPMRHLVIIYARRKEAGFFELDVSADRKTYTDNPNTLLLRGYSVKPELQRRGVATGSIRALPEFVRSHFPDINEVVLGVMRGTHRHSVCISGLDLKTQADDLWRKGRSLS